MGLKIIFLIAFSPSDSYIYFPATMSYSLTDPFTSPEMINLLLGENCSDLTKLECEFRLRIDLHILVSQSLILASILLDAMRKPYLFSTDMLFTKQWWAVNSLMISNLEWWGLGLGFGVWEEWLMSNNCIDPVSVLVKNDWSSDANCKVIFEVSNFKLWLSNKWLNLEKSSDLLN